MRQKRYILRRKYEYRSQDHSQCVSLLWKSPMFFEKYLANVRTFYSKIGVGIKSIEIINIKRQMVERSDGNDVIERIVGWRRNSLHTT